MISMLIPAQIFCLDITVGGKAGFGHSGYSGSDHRDYLDANNQKNAFFPTFAVGGFGTVVITEMIDIQPELLLEFTGAKAKSEDSDDFWRERYTFLSIPVLAKINFNVFNQRVYCIAGPGFRIALGDAKGKEEIGGVETEYEIDREDLNAFLLTAIAGIGYNWPLAEDRLLTFDLRFNYSISKSFDQDAIDDNHRLWSIVLMVGYGLNL
jgi:hypothetical protein